MSRALHIIGIVLLLIAFIHLFLASVSLPYFFTLDFVRLHFKRSGLSIGNAGTSLKELRVSTLQEKVCFRPLTADYSVRRLASGRIASMTCITSAPAAPQLSARRTHSSSTALTTPSRSLQPGLGDSPSIRLVRSQSISNDHALSPHCSFAAAGLTFVALLLTLTSDARVRLLSAFASLFACLTTLIAFAIDIALFVNVKHRVAKIEDLDIDTKPWVGKLDSSPPDDLMKLTQWSFLAFWLTLVGFLLTLMAPLMILLGRRARAAAKLAADDSSSTTTTSESLVKGRTSNLSA